jgi:hypothetical protein
MGHRHAPFSQSRGSVFECPLVDRDEYSLWFEHVISESGEQLYWLMWYGPDKRPTIPLSGVMDRDDIAKMQRLFASFVP